MNLSVPVFRRAGDNETVVEVQSNVLLSFESTMDKAVDVYESYSENGFYYYKLLFPTVHNNKPITGRKLKIKSYGFDTYTLPLELKAKVPVGLLVINETQSIADNFFNQGKYAEALKEYEKVFSINPKDSYIIHRIELCNKEIDKISVAQQVNDTISVAQQVNDTIRVAQQVNDTISMAQQVNDTISVAQQVNDTISVAQQVNDTNRAKTDASKPPKGKNTRKCDCADWRNQDIKKPQTRTSDVLANMKLNEPDLYRQYRSGKKRENAGLVLALLGTGAALTGFIALSEEDAGIAIGSAGSACWLVGSIVGFSGSIKQGRTLQAYQNRVHGEARSDTPHFQLNLHGNGLGLAFVF
jgi:tetratricopeptide (TPR) repeat protein